MPTYDYVCEACEHQFEHFQSMTSRRLRKCPECGERKLERLIGSGSGVIFKGSGFYETDYKRSGESAPAETSSSSSSSSKSDSTSSKSTSPSKSDTKSDAKKGGSAAKDD